MLRLVHTSDWHLGHTLHGRDRRFEHGRFLAWLLDTLVEQRADALLIAGDVFETANPPASAIADFNQFVAAARHRLPALDIVIIAGNHDSALRLDAMAPLMRFADVDLIGSLPRTEAGELDGERLLCPLRDADGQVAAWLAAVPFLRSADLPPVPSVERGRADAEGETEADGASDEGEAGEADAAGEDEPADEPDEPAWMGDPLIRGVATIYAEALDLAEAAATPEQALIAAGHLYMRGTTLSQLSERKILGGNQHAIPREILDRWAYVGLGHLHLAQAVEQSELVRYSGSPIPLSLSEADYPHQILLCHFEGPELQLCQSLEVPRAVDVLRVPAEAPGRLDEVLFELETMSLDAGVPREQWPWLEVRVRLDEPVPDLRNRIDRTLRARPVRLLKISVEHGGEGGSLADFPVRRELERIDPEQVFVDCYERGFGDKPDAELLAAFHELREAVAGGDASSAELPPAGPEPDPAPPPADDGGGR